MYSFYQPIIATCFLLSSLIFLTIGLNAKDILQNLILVTPSSATQLLYPSRMKPSAKKMRNAYDYPAEGYSFTKSLTEHAETEEKLEKERKPTVNSTKASVYSSCLFKYVPSSCKPSAMCATNKLCVQITGDPCCASPQGECPTSIQLNIRCVKGNPINWCHHHIDCARKALCCDSGCGYNVCVEQQEI